MECTSRVFVRADGISLLALRPLCAVVKLVLRFENTAQQTDPLEGKDRINNLNMLPTELP